MFCIQQTGTRERERVRLFPEMIIIKNNNERELHEIIIYVGRNRQRSIC